MQRLSFMSLLRVIGTSRPILLKVLIIRLVLDIIRRTIGLCWPIQLQRPCNFRRLLTEENCAVRTSFKIICSERIFMTGAIAVCEWRLNSTPNHSNCCAGSSRDFSKFRINSRDSRMVTAHFFCSLHSSCVDDTIKRSSRYGKHQILPRPILSLHEL